MEFKFNKIDTDIRRKLEEKIRDDKVHGNNNIRLKKDIKEHDNKEKQYINKDTNEKSGKKFFTIDAIKKSEKIVVIEVEKLEELGEENFKGIALDIKK